MKTLNPIRIALLCASVLFTHSVFAGKPPPPPPTPPPSSGTLVLDYAGPDGNGASSWGLVVAPSGGLYAVGNDYRADGYRKQLVLASGDSGNSWTTVDDYEVAVDEPARARCFTADANGNLFVTGYSRGAFNSVGYLNHWIVRKSVGGTGPWTTVDDFQHGGAYARPNAIAADVWGNVFVGGDGGGHWLIKRY